MQTTPLPNLVDLNSLLKDLPTIPNAQYEADPRAKCLPGTRVELLQNIRAWIADPAGLPIFWLCGQAGTGKTTISLTVADDCERRKQLGASFLFSRDHIDRRELRHVFPTIARQLSGMHQQYATFLAEILARKGGVGEFQPDVHLERLILEPLQMCEDFHSPIVIVIDALDECKDDSPVSTFLDILHPHLHRIPMLKFFVTSRPEPHITTVFTRELERETRFITLHDIHSKTVDEDIKLVIRTLLSQGARVYPDLAAENWPSGADVCALAKRSAQLFIYAVTAIRVILDPEYGDPRARLDDILRSSGDASSAVTIDTLYFDILEAAYPTRGRSQNQDHLRNILGAILVLASPLPPKTLEVLLGLNQGRVRTVLRRLHSVLVIPESDEAPICIIHPSFFDFLTARCTDVRFRIDGQYHHEQLAICCFKQMHQGLKPNICQLYDPSKLNQDIEDLQDQIQRFPPSLRYACRYWGTHLRHSCQDNNLFSLLDRFLSHRLLHWIEAMSFLGLIEDGEHQLRAAESFVVLFPTSRTSKLLEEGREFVSLFRDIFSKSALYIYVIASRLLKPTSSLRQTYGTKLEGPISDSLSRAITQSYSSRHDIRHISPPSPSSDGTFFAFLAGGNTIQIWNTALETHFATLRPSAKPVWIQFLPEPRHTHIVCISDDHTVTIWEVTQPQNVESASLQHRPNPLSVVRYATDAHFHVLGMLSDEGAVYFWDTRTWQVRAQRLPESVERRTISEMTPIPGRGRGSSSLGDGGHRAPSRGGGGSYSRGGGEIYSRGGGGIYPRGGGGYYTRAPFTPLGLSYQNRINDALLLAPASSPSRSVVER